MLSQAAERGNTQLQIALQALNIAYSRHRDRNGVELVAMLEVTYVRQREGGVS
jgi:hypothetical protein